MTKKLLAFASFIVIAYSILFAACACAYIMTWFVTMSHPNIDITAWSESERFILFLYLFVAAPIVAHGIYRNKRVKLGYFGY